MKSTILSFFAFSFLLFISCSTDDDAGDIADDRVEAPENYTFERDGSSTVSFTGQTQRIQMATILTTSTFLNVNSATETMLLNQFRNENNPFVSSELNASGKSLKSKVAASADYFATNTAESTEIRNEFESWISAQANVVFPNSSTVAAAGVAGQILDGTSTRYVDEKGLELNQVFAKSLIGALMLDQTVNNYLSVAVLDAGDNREKNNDGITEENKSYTTMEHKWDEAYGYVYGASGNPADPELRADSFLNQYLGRLEEDPDFAGIADDVFNAFKLGRAAIVEKNYEVRDEQADIIREKLSLVIGVRSVHYLMGGKSAFESGDFGGAFHDLSEGYGFIYSLQFTRNPETNAPYFSRAEVNAFIQSIMSGANGLWDVDPAVLESISAEIAARFGFAVSQA